MSNFRRRLMMSIKKSKLPSGYTELEYLESTGTQYIDTGIIPDTTLDKMEVDMAITKNKTNYTNIIGRGASVRRFICGCKKWYVCIWRF